MAVGGIVSFGQVVEQIGFVKGYTFCGRDIFLLEEIYFLRKEYIFCGRDIFFVKGIYCLWKG